jgi:hypothetical protein
MTEPKAPKSQSTEPETDEDARAIVARRGRFVAAALTGITGAALAAACASAEACLSMIAPEQDAATDGDRPGDATADAPPVPCLSIAPVDAGDAGDASDAEPTPCLRIAPDAGDGG